MDKFPIIVLEGRSNIFDKDLRDQMSADYRGLTPERVCELRKEARKRNLVLRSRQRLGRFVPSGLAAASTDILLAHTDRGHGQCPLALQTAQEVSSTLVSLPEACGRIQVAALADSRGMKRQAALQRQRLLLDSEATLPSVAPPSLLTPAIRPSLFAIPACEGHLPTVDFRANMTAPVREVLQRAPPQVRHEFVTEWEKRLQVVYQRDCEPLNIQEQVPSKCNAAGVCICSGEGVLLGMFVDKFLAAFRKQFPTVPKGGYGPRNFLKSADVVIELRMDQEGAPQQLWYHVSMST